MQEMQKTQVRFLVQEDPPEKTPTPMFLPGKSHGQSSLAGYSPQGRKESVKTEWLNNDNCLVSVSLLDCKLCRDKVLS